MTDTYKGIAAKELENDVLRLTFLPKYGCKLVSLIFKPTGREFLFQSEADTLEIPPYGANFAQYDASGFDEVFPSLNACPYPEGPFAGTPVPDHGELWTLPWSSAFSPDNTSARSFVQSDRFPYTFSRAIQLKGNEVLFEYTVENLSDASFPFIWMPHCLLACSPYTRLLVPPHLNQIINVSHTSHHLGQWGTHHPYPVTIDSNGKQFDLSQPEPPSAQNCEDFYFTMPNTEGWCGIEHTDTGEKLLYAYDAEQVPYLGVWKSHAGFRSDYNLALKPCTGLYDDLYIAHKTCQCRTIPAQGKYSWNFKITLEGPAQPN